MKKLFFILAIFVPIISSYGQNLDAFFEQPADSLTLLNIRSHYSGLYKNPIIAEEEAAKTSVLLKNTDEFKYLMNEITRVQLLTFGGDTKRALIQIEKLQQIEAVKKNPKLNGYYNNVLGGIYYSMSKPVKARKYYYLGIKLLAQAGDSVGLKGNLINVGNTFSSQLKSDSAKLFYNKATELQDAGIREFEFSLQNNIASTYTTVTEIELAKDIYEELLLNNKQLSAYEYTMTTYNLGNTYFQLGRTAEAIEMLKKAEKLAKENSLKNTLPNIFKTLGLAYKTQGEYDKSVHMLLKCDSINLSVKNAEIEEFAANLSLKHQGELYEKEQSIQLERIAYEQEKQFLLKILLASLVILLLLIIYSYLKKRQKNKILLEKNIELSQASIVIETKKNQDKNISDELIINLENALYEKQVFKDPEISLEWLSKKLDTNRTYLSEHFNHLFDAPFRSIINKLRIAEARKLLKDEKFAHYSIEGIAISVGYRNISSFNSSFKKETGLTPSYFRNNTSNH